jgi:sulfide:quinone oxidoreductase
MDMQTSPSPILIIGAGPAGIAAGIQLQRYGMHPIILERRDIGGLLWNADLVENYPGFPNGVSGAKLVGLMKKQVERLGVEVRLEQVQQADWQDDRFVITTSQATHLARTLIIASGTRIAPDETEGLTGPGWRTKMFDFYTLEGATALANAFANWGGGRLVINVVEMPIKCPVAPLEFAFLADWFFTMRGMRDRVDITYATPLDGAFTKPICTRALSYLLDEKHVHLLTEFNAGRVDGEAGVLASWDEREVPFDMLVSIPLHQGAEFVKHTPGLGDDAGFVKTDHHTLQSKLSPSIFAIGDATNVPASKAGSVAHFEGEILEENIARFLEGQPPEPAFDGHANCFIETGFDKALLIDFNYDTEPLPGKFPFARIGPMSLLSESKVNHLGKMAFKWIYWNLLLPGHDMPGIKPQMTMTGKEPPAEFAGR